ncbi:hypothetical protein F4778DRAFT_786187 [Xylariomycetidae sp. FL2044]|nr:hypothetical protein F4778DRAFT_786187 [Xylariomycetidae sp. FL2044]
MSASTFSYAQAAKAQPAAPQLNANQNSATKDVAPATSTRAPSVAVSTASNDVDTAHNTRSSSAKPESSRLNSNDADAKSTSDTATTSSQTAGESTISAPAPSTGKSLGELSERRGREPTSDSSITDATENRKPRKGKKSKSGEKDTEHDETQDKKEIVQKVELSEAPLPAVNIWAQRREAQAAKAKTVAPPIQPLASTATQTTPAASESKQKPTSGGAESRATVNGPPSHAGKSGKKDFEQSRNNGTQGPRRTAPRGARAHEKDDRGQYPSLAKDASAWPTPESAGPEPKPQKSGEKSDRDEKDETGSGKPRQKEKWSQLPFNYSVKFETPMPNRSARGGRAGGSRGGRDAGSSGSHNGSTATSTGITSYSPTTRSRFTKSSQDRGQDSAPGSRTAPASKRSSVDLAVSRDARKLPAQAEASKATAETMGAAKAESSKTVTGDLANGLPIQQTAARGQFQRSDDGSRHSESRRDSSIQSPRDADHQGQNGMTHRGSDRPRGGNRSRGGHSNSNGAAHHAQMHYSQGHSSYPFPAGNSMRQPSQPYSPGYPQMTYNGGYAGQPTSGYHKSKPSRSHIPNGVGRYSNGRMPSVPPMAPVNMSFDPNTTMYQASYPYYGGGNELYQVVLSQMEYYFSIDNLCKDWYLRQHMDGQGFVQLGFITSFRRMQELNVDYNLVRSVCEGSRDLEFVIGSDGVERIRRRDGWLQFVIKPEYRHESAQNEGPDTWHLFRRQSMPQFHHPVAHPPYQVEAHPPMFSPTGSEPTHAPYMNGAHMGQPMTNGINGHRGAVDSQLSAAVPEFSPSGFLGNREPSTEQQNSLNGTKQNGSSPVIDSPAPLLNGNTHITDNGQQASIPDPSTVNGVSDSH